MATPNITENSQLRDRRIIAANESETHEGYEFLSAGKNEIFELFVSVRDNFDGSEYQQGKKDGLRCALALLGMPEMAGFNRGMAMAREAAPAQGEPRPDTDSVTELVGILNTLIIACQPFQITGYFRTTDEMLQAPEILSKAISKAREVISKVSKNR